MENNEWIAAEILAHRFVLAEVIAMITTEQTAQALHEKLIARVGTALDNEALRLSVDTQSRLDAVFALSARFRPKP